MFTRILLLFVAILSVIASSAQTQTVRGIVRDKESHQPLQGAKVKLTTKGVDSIVSLTKEDGSFELNNVPLGRQDFNISAAAYKPQIVNNIVITAGKEVILNFDLEDDIVLQKTIEINVKAKSGTVNNEHAFLSARLFTVEETDRYAGSRGDPARMASNFAGVQGADDSRNDIVVRGNSPQGVLWRLEGIDIPNPNHFAIPGTTGGSVSIINNKILGNSDFFTGAFPAEYGNSTAGVFDLRMRNGNNKKLEFSSQLGFLGWDVMAEGPLKKGSKSSFLFTYRYSTLSLFSILKIPIGTDATPNYQDFSYKFNFPFKNNKGNFSVFGIGGLSKINILVSNQTESTQNLYSSNDRDQNFGSRLGIFGSQLNYNINTKTYLKWSFAFNHQMSGSKHQLVFRHITDTIGTGVDAKYKYKLDSIVPNLYYRLRTNTLTSNLMFNTKKSGRTSYRYGLILSHNSYNFLDTNRNFDYLDTAKYWTWSTRWDTRGYSIQIQPYFQMRYKLSQKMLMTAGATSNVFLIADPKSNQQNTSVSAIEPRAGLRYQLKNNQSINFGLGLHSQAQSGYIYYYIKPGSNKPHNINMGLTKSMHYVLGYDKQIGKNKKLHIETYYQSVFNVPIEIKNSSFSLANTGTGFSRFFPDSLVNNGIGRNFGLEFTFEKYFTQGYYYLATLSLFDAKYKGSDGVWRNSDFNTDFAFNGLFAKEITFKKKNALNIGVKYTMAGARRFSPMNLEESKRQREYVEVNNLKNTKRFGSNYMRADLRVSYRINRKKITHEFAIDLVNVTNRQNILKYSYINEAPYYKQDYQLGFLPLFYYKIDF